MADEKHIREIYDDGSDLDEEYFARTYQPLSNLPTPPPSCRDSIASLSPRSLFEQDELRGSALLGPAVHLVNLVPPKASLATPSVPTVHEILARADLPSETIALAVCILDSLNSKFPQNWRQSCPLAPDPEEAVSPALHIDAVRPEVIVLASLIVAVKFLEDYQEPTHHYAVNWGGGLWTCEQINATERCIMESLGYRIMPLWDRALIGDALADMERAGRQAHLDRQRLGSAMSTSSSCPPTSARKTVAGPGQQPTPAETPEFEHVAWSGSGTGAGGALLQPATTGGPAAGYGLDPRLAPRRGEPDEFPFPSASATPPR